MVSDPGRFPRSARHRWPHPERSAGRHALDEDRLFTPIFHEMTRDDLPVIREPRRPLDDERRFRRDPLTAPIPIPVLTSTWLPDLEPSPPPRRPERVYDPGPPSGFVWDGREWRPGPRPWDTDPAMQALTDTGRHHLVA